MRGGPASREAVRRSRGGSGLLGTGASSAATAIAGVGWVAAADLVVARRSGSWAADAECHERPRSGYGKHRH
jgi:hypothetical protein